MGLRIILTGAAALAASGAPRAAPPALSATTCLKQAAAAAGDELRSARARLAAIPLEADETLVPIPASRAIQRVKDRLRDFVRAEMACAPGSPEPGTLAAAMAARGGFARDRAERDPGPGPADRHGGFLAFEVHRIDSRPDMLAVVATLGIKCGSDSMLILYRREGGRWRELMVRRSEPYSEIRGGWHDLRFAVSPPDPQGKWFVATVSTTPWCTSAWQGMPYELARAGPAPERPRIFFQGKSTIYLGNESDLTLRAGRDWFEMRHDGSSLDPDILIRRHLRRYSVIGESVRRVQPVAKSVRDFADEWIVAPWTEAKDWSGSDPALASAHSSLKSARFETLGGFASIRSCEGGRSQVEIADSGGTGWFLIIRGGANGPWTMEQAARGALERCTGPDILKREPA